MTKLTRENVFKALHDESINMEAWPAPIRDQVKVIREWISGYHDNPLRTVVATSILLNELVERRVTQI